LSSPFSVSYIYYKLLKYIYIHREEEGGRDGRTARTAYFLGFRERKENNLFLEG